MPRARCPLPSPSPRAYADFYYRVRHLYWAIDEFKYWTMGWPVEETEVINRARVDAPEPWKAKT